MSRVAWIAWREFVATVATKGFIIGILVTPALIGVMIVVMPMLMNRKPPKVVGEVAIVDPTGEVIPGVEEYLTPEAFAGRSAEMSEKIQKAMEEMPAPLRKMADQGGVSEATEQALSTVLGEVPEIAVTTLTGGADLEAEKDKLLHGSSKDGGRLALVVVHEDAVEKAPDKDAYGRYDLFVREKLDDRIEDEIKDGLYESIVAGRVRHAGLDREQIESITRMGRIRSTMITEEGEKETNEVLNVLLPAAFMVLLLIAVFTGGQQIMTTTVEEKSSRVVEVLLSAVSPMQLMTGKIVGQLGVGLVLLAIYSGMGIVALVSFALLGLIDLWLLFYLVVFYFIAYFTIGSLMAAIGAAVNQMSEAQNLMTPVILVMMIPWLLWMPISRDPNSVFATVVSFVPPVNSFVMLLRMSSTAPPPLWQVWLSILVGAAGVYAALWVAAKVFRVGLLMHGKPPNFTTLIRWIRMA